MRKNKQELFLLILVIPILAYVGWQIYDNYVKQHDSGIEWQEPTIRDEGEIVPVIPDQEIEPESSSLTTQFEQTAVTEPEPVGKLDSTGFIERDPLRHSLPAPAKKEPEKLPEEPVTREQGYEMPEEKIPEEQVIKEVILPTFEVSGIVWGNTPASARAIIENKIYGIGDTVKGAKITDINTTGIHMVYEEKTFTVTVQ